MTAHRVNDTANDHVLAWITDYTLEHLTALLRESSSSRGGARIALTHIRHMTDLLENRASALPLLFEPEIALREAACVEEVAHLARGLLTERIDQPLVLMCRLTAPSVRALQHFASIPSAILFVLGVDTIDDLLRMVRERRPRPYAASIGRPIHKCLRLPVHVRRVVLAALESPADWTVKRLASEANVSRRTLERLCRKVDLDSPSVLLRRALRPATDSGSTGRRAG